MNIKKIEKHLQNVSHAATVQLLTAARTQTLLWRQTVDSVADLRSEPTVEWLHSLLTQGEITGFSDMNQSEVVK